MERHEQGRHFGTGDLEVRVERVDQVAKVKELAPQAYEGVAK